MRSLTLWFLLALSGGSAAVLAVPDSRTFEGTITATLTRHDGVTTPLLFTCQTNRVRIECTDQSKSEPINVIDLSSGAVTFLFPHNSTFIRLDNPAANVRNPSHPSTPNTGPGLPPEISSLNPTNPPDRINLPAGPLTGPPGISPGAPTPGALPFAVPAIPMEKVNLQKTEERREIQGLPCARYSGTNRWEKLEVWAVEASTLFPFRILEQDYSRRPMNHRPLTEQWVEVIQKNGLFPVEAIVRDYAGAERLSFRVTKIEKKKLRDVDALFEVPKDYHELRRPPF